MAVLVRGDIAAHIRADRPTRDIMRLLGVPRAAVEAVANQLGRPASTRRGFRPSSLEDAFWGQVRHLPDGHLLWLGDHDPHGAPVLWCTPFVYSARRVSYELRHGRHPDGPLTQTCGHDQCVEADHLADPAGRQYLATVVTTLFGEPTR